MRMLTRSIPVAALALALGALPAAAQEPGNGNFQWYIGAQGGVMLFDTPAQDREAMPTFGGQTLIVARRTVSPPQGSWDCTRWPRLIRRSIAAPRTWTRA